MTELINILHNNRNVPKRVVCLTFDDGYENVIKNAYPLMVKYGAKGCLYIIPSLIGKKDPLWTDLIDIVLWKNTESHFKFLFDQEINYPTNSKGEIAAAIIDIKRKLRSVTNDRRLELLKQFQSMNFEDIPEERGAKIVRSLPEVKVFENTQHQEESLRLQKGAGGGGDQRARVTKKGVLGITSGQIKGKYVASADLFGKGGYATEIDALLQGNAGLKIKGSGGAGRKGAAGIGYGAGYTSGFGGGSGGIDDLVGSIMSAELGLKREKQKHKEPSVTWKRSGITANTSRLSIGERDTLPLKGSQITVQVDGFRARVLIDLPIPVSPPLSLGLSKWLVCTSQPASPYI